MGQMSSSAMSRGGKSSEPGADTGDPARASWRGKLPRKIWSVSLSTEKISLPSWKAALTQRKLIDKRIFFGDPKLF